MEKKRRQEHPIDSVDAFPSDLLEQGTATLPPLSEAQKDSLDRAYLRVMTKALTASSSFQAFAVGAVKETEISAPCWAAFASCSTVSLSLLLSVT